ncbi:MAG: CorA family divalent cation transporter [Patescibacteria group bacterium]
MTTTHSYRGIAWIDLESPNDNEITGLVRRYGLHPLVGEELKSSSALAKIDFYADYILVVLTLPVRVKQGNNYTVVDREIDFVIGKTFLITSRFDTIEQIEYFAKIFEANSILGKDEQIEHAGHMFYYMVKRLYAGMNEDLENIKDALLTAETSIFNGDERNMVRVLSNVSRELIDFRQTSRIHRDIWDNLIDSSDNNPLGKEFLPYARDMRDEFNHVHELVGNCRELLADLRETNDSLLSTKQNEIIKTLTLIACIFYPLSFIAALFTIPALSVPIINISQGWNIVLLIMIACSSLMWWWFKKKRWI